MFLINFPGNGIISSEQIKVGFIGSDTTWLSWTNFVSDLSGSGEL